jgi:hypothetical protein
VCTSGAAGTGGGGTPPVDSDGDGIPDAVDQCPAIANTTYAGLSYCPVSLYDVVQRRIPVGAIAMIVNLAVSGVQGTLVTLAIGPSDPNYSGPASTTVNWPNGSIPQLGQRVTLFGVVQPNGALSVTGYLDLGY